MYVRFSVIMSITFFFVFTEFVIISNIMYVIISVRIAVIISVIIPAFISVIIYV